MHDYSMLDLFRQEVETQATNLRQSLLILKGQPSLVSELDTAMRSLHTIAGAAQLVEIDAAAKLAQDLQAGLMAVQNHTVELTEDAIAHWLHGTDLLVEISHASDKNLERWLSEHGVDLAATQTAIRSVIADGAAPYLSENGSSSQVQLKPVERGALPQPQQENHLDAIAQSNVAPEIAPLVATAISTEDSYEETASAPAFAIGDSSMLDLFRLEVEAQGTILSNGLVALEVQPDSAPELEALMRAAHSIKGAARIVRLDAAVEVAHVMEDCFVAAQKQTITLAAEQIDALLRGVDFLQNLSQLSDRDLPDWLEKNALAIAAIRSTISTLVHSSETPTIPPEAAPLVPVVIAPTVPVLQSASVSGTEADATVQARVVRVSAENLNRMMGLAGESLIGANWLPLFSEALMLLKTRQIELAKSLEVLQQEAFSNNSTFQEGKALLDTARRKERECRDLLNNRLTELEGFVQRSTNLSDRLYREVIATHMRPFEDGVQGFARMIRDIARKLNKQVKLEILGKSTSVDRDILTKLEAPLTHILRNAVDHAIESPEERQALGKSPEGTIRLEAFHRGGMLSVAIADDGKGIDVEMLRTQAINRKLAPPEIATKLTDAELMEFLFLPGFSLTKNVTELSGRGVGLDIAKIMAQEVGGTVRVTSALGKGTNFQFQLPLTLSVIRTLLVDIAGEAYAFPLARIERILTLQPSDIATIENRPYFTLDDKNIGLISAAQVLELPTAPLPDAPLWIIILSDATNTYGLLVDRCLGERELVVRPLDPCLGKVPDVSAAALMEDGSLVLIVDVSDLVRSMNALLASKALVNVGATPTRSDSQHTTQSRDNGAGDREAKRILVVDDSIAVREMERKLLQNRGYRVEVAVDGMEGWNAVRAQPYDLVISDIDMPRMNGIELIGQIKQHPRLKSIPVIVVSYRDREEDRLQGLDAGADYYLTKSSFHDDTLIKAVMDLIGE